MSSLSVVIVTRFQDACLPDALASALPVTRALGGEVLVVDTARADSTWHLTRPTGAVYVPHEWDDDFAAARNEGLARASREWVLLLHPDEVVAGFDPARVDRELASDGIAAYGVRVEERHRPDQPPPYVDSTPLRLFRRSLDLHYVGRLLPTFETPPAALAEFQGRSLQLASLLLHRHAWHAEITPAKLRWTLKLLDRELADRPGQIGYEIERALTLRRLGDPRAPEDLAAAAARLWQHRDQPQAPSLNCGDLLEYLLGLSPNDPAAVAAFDDLLRLSSQWFPDSPAVLNKAAEACYQRGDFLQAALLLERLLDLGETGSYARTAPINPDVFGDGTRINFALCLMRTGQLPRAAAVLAGIGPNSPHAARARDHLQRLAALGVTPGA